MKRWIEQIARRQSCFISPSCTLLLGKFRSCGSAHTLELANHWVPRTCSTCASFITLALSTHPTHSCTTTLTHALAPTCMILSQFMIHLLPSRSTTRPFLLYPSRTIHVLHSQASSYIPATPTPPYTSCCQPPPLVSLTPARLSVHPDTCAPSFPFALQLSRCVHHKYRSHRSHVSRSLAAPLPPCWSNQAHVMTIV